MATDAERRMIAELRNHCDKMNAIMEKFSSPVKITYRICNNEIVGGPVTPYIQLEAVEQTKL